MTEAGWPTLADVHRELVAMRSDLREVAAELRHQRQELERHRADDDRRFGELGRRQWRLALTVAGLAAGPAGALGAVVTQTMGG